ncbi:MAG TPA: dTDP-4-dehydrorhamnose 3,5-epimerase family protein, partial [Saprospiraceae bacterium]|nr:dTDP-4-dehydrorhamnose 3,5-epimerase family protein [Saprospiraceae bacterium]
MSFTTIDIEGIILFQPRIFEDERGYFYESYRNDAWLKLGVNRPFVQENQAYSSKGTLRGLHYQRGNMAQAKLVRV